MQMLYPKIIVCQRGARHRYFVPKILEDIGMLEALYTDSSSFSFLGRVAPKVKKLGIKHSRLEALARRKPSGISANKIFSTDTLLFREMFGKSKRNPLEYADVLSTVYKRWGVRSANIIYTMNVSDIPFIEYAKAKGLKVIVDIFVSPLTEKILADEALRLPNANAQISKIHIKKMEQRYLRIFELADILLCPSEWVAESCKKLNPHIAHKISVCPYGSSVKPAPEAPIRSGKKILFAGRDGFRKGLNYLADASESILTQFPDAEILIAGIKKEDALWVKEHENLTFLGHVPMDEMKSLFESTSAFILPSLSEGQAGVVLEALSMGCPVIITRECGVDIEDGKQGFIIPAKNSKSIVEKVTLILSNDELRNEMSLQALKFSGEFCVGDWSDRLKAVCHSLIKKEI